MKLSKATRVFVAFVTLFVITMPFLFMGIVLLALLPSAGNALPSSSPLFQLGFSLTFALICLASLANYGLIAFYVAHIVKTPQGSDVLRTVLGIAIFFFPFFGMPAYFLIYIWPD